jgi:ketosteroid isomerase-like protein
MDTKIAEIASNFSRHRFDQTYRFMQDDIEWTQVGGTHARGKDAVVSVCEESAKHLAQVTTTFHHFRVIEADDCVVIDTRAEYVDKQDGSSSVASCDIFDFSNGKLAGVTSYTVELETGSATA